MTEEMLPASPEVVICPATAGHIRELARTLREKDRAEIESYGFSCAKGLWRSFRRGAFNKTALIDNAVAASWGCGGELMGTVGIPWLLTTPKVYRVSPLRFARLYQNEVRAMLNLFPRLENYVAVDYEEAIRLLSVVGFTIGEPERYGNGMFRKFSMERV